MHLRCSSPTSRLICIMLCVSSVLCYAFISSISFVCLVRLSCSSRSSVSFVSCVYLIRLSNASCICYAVRLSHASVYVSSVPVCAAHITPLRSFKHVKRVNSFKRLVLLIPNFPSVRLL